MQDFRFSLGWRFLRGSKGNFIAGVMTVVFGILFIHVNNVIFDGVWEGLIRDFSGFVYGDVYVTHEEDYITRSDSALVKYIENFPQVASATPRLYSIASINATKNGKIIEEFRIDLVGVHPVQDIRTASVDEYVSDPQFVPTRTSIVLGDVVARDLGGLQVGDKVDVEVEDRWGQDQIKQFTVSDVATIYGAFGDETYIHIDTLREMLDRKGETGAIMIKLHDRADTDELKGLLREFLRDDDYLIESLEEAGRDTLDLPRSGIAMVGQIAYFALTSSGVIIFAIQMMVVKTKTKQIGIIRAIGGKRNDVLVIFLIQGAVMGVIGAVLGTFAGLGFAEYMDAAEFRFGDGDGGVSIPLEITHHWDKITRTALFALFLSVIGALTPAYMATRVSPVEAMTH